MCSDLQNDGINQKGMETERAKSGVRRVRIVHCAVGLLNVPNKMKRSQIKREKERLFALVIMLLSGLGGLIMMAMDGKVKP